MIYKFTDYPQETEVEVGFNDETPHAFISIKEYECTPIEYKFNKHQLYDLIGALHSIQSKINKIDENV
jgi:hypothetical protein